MNCEVHNTASCEIGTNKQYIFIYCITGEEYTYYCCDECLSGVSETFYNITLISGGTKYRCTCGLILCKECLKNVKDVIDF